MLIIFAHLISEQKEKINSLATILRIGILYMIPMFLVYFNCSSAFVFVLSFTSTSGLIPFL